MSTDTEKSSECVMAGATYFLEKPIDIEMVV